MRPRNGNQTASGLRINPVLADGKFDGFEPLNSNYVYCPNQFFDVCLKSASRGMTRVVAYCLRQTLGWLDENGQPINQTVKVTYRELIEKAGISRGAISTSLQQAVNSGFLECCVAGAAKRSGSNSQTAEFRLRWDNGTEYKKSPEGFNGFFAGEGNRTPVPNSFFDRIIPNEKLSVIKVVGTIIRHTIGYQNQFGGRRKAAALSCSFIQSYANIGKRKAVVDALRYAEQYSYIQKVEQGCFSPDKRMQAAAVYTMRVLVDGRTNAMQGRDLIPHWQEAFALYVLFRRHKPNHA